MPGPFPMAREGPCVHVFVPSILLRTCIGLSSCRRWSPSKCGRRGWDGIVEKVNVTESSEDWESTATPVQWSPRISLLGTGNRGEMPGSSGSEILCQLGGEGLLGPVPDAGLRCVSTVVGMY